MRRSAARLSLLLLLALALTACAERGTASPAQPDPDAGSHTQAVAPAAETEPAPEEAPAPEPAPESATGEESTEVPAMSTLKMRINDREISVEWEENASVDALAALAAPAPLTVRTSAYGGFEQVGPLGTSVPRDDAQITTQPGDVMLYAGDQIVLFHGANTWAYTRLGRITGMTSAELTELLGADGVTVTLYLE